MSANTSKLIADIAAMGGTYFARQRKAKRMRQLVKCAYCGAPDQRVATRCEFCQVFVSKEAVG